MNEAPERIWARIEEDDQGFYIEYMSDTPWPETDPTTEYLRADIAAAEIARLTEALAASEETRRAERAAVVREAAERNDIISKVWSHYGDFKRAQAAILALATDADNAALDKLLREARKEGMERAALAVTERADQEDEFATIHEKRGNGYKAVKAARVVTTLRGVAAHIRILAALEAPQ